MVQLLVTLLVPPIVGVIAYIVVRRIWEREEEENVPGEVASRREPSIMKREQIPVH